MGALKLALRLCRNKVGTLFVVILGLALFLVLANYFLGSQGGSGVQAVKREPGGFVQEPVQRVIDQPDRPPAPGHKKKEKMLNREKYQDLFSDETAQTCQIPRLNVPPPDTRPVSPMNCTGKDLFSMRNGALILNRAVLRDRSIKQCVYKRIRWNTDMSYKVASEVVRTAPPFDGILEGDFYKIVCYLDQGGGGGGGMRRVLSARDDEMLEVPKNYPNMMGSMGLPDPPQQDESHPQPREKAYQQQHPAADDLAGHQQGRLVEDVVLGEADTAQVVRSRVVLSDDNPQPQDSNEVQNPVDEQQDEDPEEEQPEEEEEEEEEEDTAVANNTIELDSETLPDFEQFIARIQERRNAMDRAAEQKPFSGSLQMNVIILAVKSMSHVAFQHRMPKTYGYLRDKLEAVIMNGFNIVGEGTQGSFVPILTGKTLDELPRSGRSQVGANYVDQFPFIWNKFERSGYVTLFAEDKPQTGTFQETLEGYQDRPVDHYMRTFWLGVDQSRVGYKSQKHCLGPQPRHNYMLNYLLDFINSETYKDIPKFAFSFLTELTFGDCDSAVHLDEDLADLLQYINEQGYLDNTMLVVMGDHGVQVHRNRDTDQGSLEERLPMFAMVLPDEFREDHASVMKNLRNNVDRLTTPFDFHETMRTLLDFKRVEQPVDHKARGISLFKDIPMNRTCTSAGISHHRCACMRRIPLSRVTPDVEGAVNAALQVINTKTEHLRDWCDQLVVHDVTRATLVIPSEKVLEMQDDHGSSLKFLDEIKSARDLDLPTLLYHVTFTTQPSGARYDATVQLDTSQDKYTVIDDVSNLYPDPDRGYCIQDDYPDLTKYCACPSRRRIKTEI